MRNKMKIWLILITILAAFMGEVKVESPLFGMGENVSGSPVISHREAKVNAEICTTEMLGIHSSMGECRLTAGYSNRRGEERITLFVLSVFVFMQIAGLSLSNMEVIPVRSHFSEELVTIYMHKSDGKKRI